MFKVKEEITKENYAKIILEPLEDGLGHTLGNSLRRVLLTSLLGSAVTSVKIDGVAHQFSTIEGISEDVIEIILNIKKIRININSDKSIKLTIKAAGKGIVKAGDLKIEGDGEVSNKDQVIATLNDSKAKLNMELIAEKGKGYSMAEDRKNSEIGVIAIDALFSPVVACNYTVDPTRVGRKTNFDKLTLEISTDGTITPSVALNEAAKLLSTTFLKIYEPDQEEELEISTAISDEVLKMTVEELDLPVRITNALRAIEVNTIENLLNIPRAELLKAKNLGAKSLSLISEKLLERGLNLREA
ncbi:DNA-directed RNA polymerase subunit alpha [Candidatus Daviesbacteria bacterium RIFCSPLOWO2_01_FULL_38_10]|nr:MAG: DNA-directed RNA polymerase subunit alpha [Candidatus Daviesbacteria bacterium GW2011_GWA2_38_17]OGE27176.1 MAG: DNA-directed RNA polymerase subunit alpha [Candidatus Daviesbacteria bacterium RIFCSPHIGHO2_02_FULL_39_41]OGE28825.1 MAG: DNA-directed RNA polymerase subunit alpha [Candidatus Daviesbacteria bacterium RIFCSPHIGHO2_01_FULL_38_8b]OGE40213.1 MAG: DNA-directed RNA polymerase subunit alpha [Candidatus Daviesbacteria bacterium RIFCSPLOWO2_01_FULL_38_10]OGE45229.1 MAG: DNA-directed 